MTPCCLSFPPTGNLSVHKTKWFIFLNTSQVQLLQDYSSCSVLVWKPSLCACVFTSILSANMCVCVCKLSVSVKEHVQQSLPSSLCCCWLIVTVLKSAACLHYSHTPSSASGHRALAWQQGSEGSSASVSSSHPAWTPADDEGKLGVCEYPLG